ncbi:DoxX family protein [Flavobacterium sp. 1355]|uniref:DoxX family protein n=1 Tax=Flavobacterium sp. 1355 TaxID=2806571 RepID=UPI001AE54A1A|nr:DoxX family protein [Flavobacterium sp. 1355]MBP1223670.1 putative membrane protein [Flavobacterium sp. 1355]
MKNPKHSKAILITVWIAKIILAISFIWGASLKLFQSIEKLSAMWPWTAEVPLEVVKFTGIIDLLGGIGIIAPALLSLNPKITRITAFAIIALMICAGIFHICRGEGSQIGINVFFALLASFIAWSGK